MPIDMFYHRIHISFVIRVYRRNEYFPICIILQNGDDGRLTTSFYYTNRMLIRHENKPNDSIIFFSHKLYRQCGDFVILLFDTRK